MFARYTSAIVSGSLATLLLFFFMQALIAFQPGASSDPRVRGVLSPVRVKPAEETRRIEFEPVDRSLKDPPPTAPRPKSNTDLAVGVGAPTVTVPAPRGISGLAGPQMSDGPLVAIVRVQPVYPAAAEARGLEGWVVVEFDVLRDGRVANAWVVESSNRVFEKAALGAAYRFRFKPRVVDGVPQPTQGIRNRFRFEFEGN
jgi:protein TonB